MNLSYLKNSKGLTITELIVTMGISAILLIFITSGSLFIKNYVQKQSQSSKIFEELSFVLKELESSISNGKEIVLKNDSLIVTSNSDKITIYNWGNNVFLRNNHILSSHGFRVDSLEIIKIQLRKTTDSTIFNQKINQTQSGAYKVFIKISDSKNHSDSIQTIVENMYEKIKYQQ